MRSDRFEWDDKKNEYNIRKHGINFEDAEIIFDGFVVTKRDAKRKYGEARWLALGELDGVVIIVSYTHRGNRIRIISIRKGKPRDREDYRKAIRKKAH